MTHGPGLTGFNREEFTVMAELSEREGTLPQQESKILKSLLSIHETRVEDAMTPSTVLFSIPESMTVSEYVEQYDTENFSRVPVYQNDKDRVIGFVLRDDLLLAQAKGEKDNKVSNYLRELQAVIGAMDLTRAFDELLHQRANILLVVDEYGGVEGILTLEDVVETFMGMEFIDEGDKSIDMQELARRLWRRRAKARGLKIDDE